MSIDSTDCNFIDSEIVLAEEQYRWDDQSISEDKVFLDQFLGNKADDLLANETIPLCQQYQYQQSSSDSQLFENIDITTVMQLVDELIPKFNIDHLLQSRVLSRQSTNDTFNEMTRPLQRESVDRCSTSSDQDCDDIFREVESDCESQPEHQTTVNLCNPSTNKLPGIVNMQKCLLYCSINEFPWRKELQSIVSTAIKLKLDNGLTALTEFGSNLQTSFAQASVHKVDSIQLQLHDEECLQFSDALWQGSFQGKVAFQRIPASSTKDHNKKRNTQKIHSHHLKLIKNMQTLAEQRLRYSSTSLPNT